MVEYRPEARILPNNHRSHLAAQAMIRSIQNLGKVRRHKEPREDLSPMDENLDFAIGKRFPALQPVEFPPCTFTWKTIGSRPLRPGIRFFPYFCLCINSGGEVIVKNLATFYMQMFYIIKIPRPARFFA